MKDIRKQETEIIERLESQKDSNLVALKKKLEEIWASGDTAEYNRQLSAISLIVGSKDDSEYNLSDLEDILDEGYENLDRHLNEVLKAEVQQPEKSHGRKLV